MNFYSLFNLPDLIGTLFVPLHSILSTHNELKKTHSHHNGWLGRRRTQLSQCYIFG
jgi:hypothetical protein